MFARFAYHSPRFAALDTPAAGMMDMQRQTYRIGCRSPTVVSQRANAAENFFMDIQALGFCPATITPFEVATWVRGRILSGLKTAGKAAASTLNLVQVATDWNPHLLHPIVQSQAKAKPGPVECGGEPVAALTPSVDMVTRMEELITTGQTIQIRCLAGFFTCLTFGSSRASDTQMTKNLHLTADALVGTSFMKNKKSWQKWFASRIGLRGDWAGPWMEQLALAGLPGPDFVLLAPNASFDGWLDRPAEYGDLRRSVHFLLCACLAFSPELAVLYNPHSFRHFLIESGQQLRALKACGTSHIEKLGRWKPGSTMPDVYDNASGVSELMSRHIVISTLASGWRPVAEGMLPNALPQSSASSSSVRVGHRGKKTIHLKAPTVLATVCNMWTCGSADAPAKNAMFSGIPTEWRRCPTCRF